MAKASLYLAVGRDNREESVVKFLRGIIRNKAKIMGRVNSVEDGEVKIIGAAPELLDALQLVAARWDKHDEQDNPNLGKTIRDTIAKATGEI